MSKLRRSTRTVQRLIHKLSTINMKKSTKKRYNISRDKKITNKYQCQKCKKQTNTIRVDVGLPMNQRIWQCDKCHFKR